MLKKILYLIVSLPGLFFLINNFPYLMIISVLSIGLLSFLHFIFKREITGVHFDVIAVLLIIYLYFILSYFFSNQSLNNFFSYDFFRNDGNFFFCYSPFFVLAVPFFNYKIVSKIFFKFVFFTFLGFSFIALYCILSGNYIPDLFLHTGKGYMFVALNFAHNATGSVYAMVSLSALVFFLFEKRKIKFFYLFIFIMIVFGLIITQSRGSYLGFIAGLFVILWFYLRSVKKFLIFSSIILILIAVLIYFTGFYKMIVDVYNVNDTNTLIRLNLWQKAWNLFLKSPLFGIGFGRYNDIGEVLNLSNLKLTGITGIIAYYTDPVSLFNMSHAHNSYLHFLADTGIIGLILLLFFWGLCFVKILNAYNREGSKYSKKIYLASLGIIICLFVLAITENYFSATTVILYISIVVSLAMGLYWQESNNKIMNESKID